MLGCWLRMLLSHFTALCNGVPFRDFVANLVGCALMGALATRRSSGLVARLKRFNLHSDSLVSAGLMSGFCGSLTSFSGWSQSASDAILLADFSLWIFNWLLGTASAAFAFRLCSRPPLYDDDNCADSSPEPQSSMWMLLVFLVALCVFMTVLVPVSANWMLPPLLATVGAALRFGLQTTLNKRWPSFPLGTFLCNLIGAVLLGVLRRFNAAPEPDIGDQWQNGALSLLPIVGIGFCGALSTVSSMANEMILQLDHRAAAIYSISTLLFAHVTATLVQFQV